LWFLHQIQPEDPAYNVVYTVRFRTELDIPALHRVLQKLVERHPMLRTTFAMWDGEPVQCIHSQFDVELQVEDAASWSEEQINGRLTAALFHPFDLKNGPLTRFLLLTRSANNYILLLAMHHIITDMWSLAIIMYEFGQLYQAEMTSADPRLKPQRYQYSDYVRDQNKMLAGPEGERLRAYWQKQLAGNLPVLELPTDHPRTAVPTHHGARQSVRIDATLAQQIKTLAKTNDATPFMILLAAFQALLHRYTGQEDILVGSPKASRTRQSARLIGYFINPVVLRANLSNDPTFLQLLEQVRQTTLDAFDHDAYPFPLLVEDIQPMRDPRHPPVFQVMFGWQKTSHLVNSDDMASFALGESGQKTKLGQTTIESFALEQVVSPYDLTLLIAEAGDELIATFEYNSSLFEPATIERMLGHLQTLLAGITANPHQPISTLPLLTEAERRQVLIAWNDTAVPFPHDQCAHQLFEAQVERTPDAPAVIFEGQEQLTYHELNCHANQLAHYLQKQGVGPEDLVALCVKRSPELIIGILGILKAGAAYVPMDPAYPPNRLAFMIADAQPQVLLTIDDLRFTIDNTSEAIPNHKSIIVNLQSTWSQIAQHPTTNLPISPSPDSLAYVIYTSGSTGQPKGVMLQHRGLCNMATAYIKICKINSHSRVLQFFSASFDGSVADIFMTLLGGGALYMAHSDTFMPGPNLARFLKEQAITSAVFTPSAVASLPTADLPALQTLLTGGESCTRDIVDRWSPGRRFINVYGPTETTVISTWYEVDASLPPETTNIPIGRPLPNTQLYILDKHRQPVPIGVPGELYIGGVGVARGYLNRPELTAEKFIPIPFIDSRGAEEPESGGDFSPLHPFTPSPLLFYRTGDLCRWRPDGNIEFLGRIDQQVKVRGFRIELGEIEVALAAHTAVHQCAVIIREDTPNDRRLAAYVVFQNGAVNDNELRRHLSQTLPDSMIPSIFVPLPALPLSPNGKVDRKALPAPTSHRPELETTFVQPRSDLEQTIAAIWQAALGLAKVGVHDNFFDLGGHSLLLARVHNQLQETLQTSLPMMELFRFPTISALAAYLSGEEGQRPSLEKSYTQAQKQRDAIQKQQRTVQSIAQRQAAARNRRRS
jgi:amino acid adenylation domain-containing protein